MTDATWLLVVHLAATAAMTGFAWTIQLLQYPGMADVPSSAFAVFERHHQRRVVAVLALFAPLEVVTAAWIIVGEPGSALAWSAGLLLAAIWISTGFFFAPLHGDLSGGFDRATHRRLVKWNWARTVGWTVRTLMAMVLIAG